MWSLVGADGQKWSISMFVSATFLIIIKRLMSHKFMIKIFLINLKLNANQKIWVIIDMTHKSWKMTHIFFVCIWVYSFQKFMNHKLNAKFLILVSTPFSLIFSRLISHTFMIHIFLKRINFNANKKVWVIIDMTHEPHPFINKFMVKESNYYIIIIQLRNISFQEWENPYPDSLKPRNTNLSVRDLRMD